MAECDVQLLINNGKETLPLEINGAKVNEDDDVSIEKLAEYIRNKLTDEQRENIKNTLMLARDIKLTRSDLEKGIIVSNTTINELLDRHPEMKDVYDPKTDKNNYIIIKANNLVLNGKKYGPRAINSKGQSVFVLKNMYEEKNFLKYIAAIQAIDKIPTKGKDSGIVKGLSREMQIKLDNITKKYGKTKNSETLREFLDNGELINTSVPFTDFQSMKQILNEIVNDLYNDNNLNDLALALKGKAPINGFNWTLTSENLWNILNDHIPEFKNICGSVEDLNKMSEEELNKMLVGRQGIFWGNSKLETAEIKLTKGGSNKTVLVKHKLTQKQIQDEYEKRRKNNPDLKYKDYKSMAKNDPEAFLRLFENDPIIISTNDGNFNFDVTIDDSGKIVVKANDTVKDEVSQRSHITITFPFPKLDVYVSNPGKSELIFKLCDDQSLNNGKYKGFYIYEFYDNHENKTRYIHSRSILNPDSTSTHPSNTLEEVKTAIDRSYNSTKLYEAALYNLKRDDHNFRREYIEMQGIREKQIVTVLDIVLPNIPMAKTQFVALLDKTVPQFHEEIIKINPEMADYIRSLETPEQAVAFLYLVDQNINSKVPGEGRTLDKMKSPNAVALMRDTINYILGANTRNYYIEYLSRGNKTKEEGVANGRFATIQEIKDINVIDDGVAKGPKFGEFVSRTLTDAIAYFNEQYGMDVQTINDITYEEICKNEGIPMEENVKAFIHNGVIYINTSHANQLSLYHEASHIFLGIIKARSPEAYQEFMEGYMSDRKNNREVSLIMDNYRQRDAYKYYANQDLLEEAVVESIARTMNNSGAIQNSGNFNAESYNMLMNQIMQKINNISSSRMSDLGFTTFADVMQNASQTSEEMERNRKVTNLISDMIQNEYIEEEC